MVGTWVQTPKGTYLFHKILSATNNKTRPFSRNNKVLIWLWESTFPFSSRDQHQKVTDYNIQIIQFSSYIILTNLTANKSNTYSIPSYQSYTLGNHLPQKFYQYFLNDHQHSGERKLVKIENIHRLTGMSWQSSDIAEQIVKENNQNHDIKLIYLKHILQ